MVYYDENDNIIDESQVDLAHGYLTDRTFEHHDEVAEVSHYVESAPLPSGATMKKKVIDTPYQPAWDEVTSQTYHYTGLTPEEKLRADVDELMNIGEVYRTGINLSADTWTFVSNVHLPKGVYVIDGDADEYKAVVSEQEITGDIVLTEDKVVTIYAKAAADGLYTAVIIKE